MNWKNNEWLSKQYSSGLGTNDIAKICGVSSSTICYYVKKFKINYMGKRHKTAITKNCQFCSKIFYVSKCFSKIKFCSQHCSGKWIRMNKKPWNSGLNKHNDSRLMAIAKSKIGKSTWNKGLTKTSPIVAKYAAKIKDIKSKTIKGRTYEEIFGIERARVIKRKQSAMLTGRKHTELAKRRIGESNRGKKYSLESKIKMRVSHIRAISAGKYTHLNTEPHRKLVTAIKHNNLWDGFLEEYPFEWMAIDIADPEKKLAIFVDGDYWHGNPVKFLIPNNHQVKRISIDKSQNAYLEKCGWKILRFWESEINSNLDACVAKIRGVKLA